MQRCEEHDSESTVDSKFAEECAIYQTEEWKRLPRQQRAKAEALSKLQKKERENQNDGGKCVTCGLIQKYCICRSFFPPIKSRNEVQILYNSNEVWRASNTSKVALLTLTNSRSSVFIPQDQEDKTELDGSEEDTRRPTALLFPNTESVSLTEWWDTLSESTKSCGVRVVVADGTWRQASRMVKQLRKHNSQFARTVHLENPEPVIAEPLRERTSETRLSSLESIICALRECDDKSFVIERLKYCLRCLVDAVGAQTGKQYSQENHLTWLLPSDGTPHEILLGLPYSPPLSSVFRSRILPRSSCMDNRTHCWIFKRGFELFAVFKTSPFQSS
eukprot:gb/GECG01014628.1/.p1 GENE.gb/GECG01014628.1/~~gb/GECG01014628.1/.p1  ORF type:complete len:332 (+),score=23.75 gb/GECG01014628.1/:1-996(+)